MGPLHSHMFYCSGLCDVLLQCIEHCTHRQVEKSWSMLSKEGLVEFGQKCIVFDKQVGPCKERQVTCKGNSSRVPQHTFWKWAHKPGRARYYLLFTITLIRFTWQLFNVLGNLTTGKAIPNLRHQLAPHNPYLLLTVLSPLARSLTHGQRFYLLFTIISCFLLLTS